MPNAQFFTDSYTVPGTTNTVYLRYLKANHREITFRYIGDSSVRDSAYYGINGTYFDGGPNLLGVAINNGAYIRSGGPSGYNGEQNRVVPAAIPCGTFGVLNQTINNIFLFSDTISTYNGHTYTSGGNTATLTTSNTLFAVGGTSLFTSEDLTQTQYNNRISTEDPGGGVYGVAPRTAIIYQGGDYYGLNTVLLTVHADSTRDSTRTGGLTFWELRNMIISKFPISGGYPPVHAIALDGGGSTQIAYKSATGTRETYQVADDRSVQSMLCVNM